MTTAIVEQMLVELGFDTSKFASEADKAIKKHQQLEKAITDTEKSSQKATKAHTELAEKYKSSIEQTAKFGQAIASVTKELTGFFAVIIGSTGLFKLANDVSRANMEMSKLSDQTGMSTKSLTDWRNAASAFGGSAQGMTSSLTSIKQAMNGLVMFGDASMLPYFNALGVGLVDSAGKVRQLDEVMLDLADAFQKMPTDQAYTIGKKMGFDDGTINMLVSGRKEMQEILDIQKKMYHSDKQSIALNKELNKQQAILNAHWQSMKQMIGDALTPILIRLIRVVNGFFDFMQRHEKVIKSVFQVAAMVIGLLLIPTLLNAARALMGFIAPFTPLIKVFGLLGAAISPVTIAITALGAAFLLLLDDYKTWAKGGNSLFDWTAFSNGIKDSKMSVDTLKKAFSNLYETIKNNAIPTLKGYAEIIGKLARGDFTGAANQARQMINNFSDIAIRVIADATGERKEDIGDFIGESVYRLLHGGKTYEEVNGSYEPPTKPIVIGKKRTSNSVSNSAPADAAVKAADYATKHALPKSNSDCAKYVNRSFRAQGINVWGHGKDVAKNLIATGKFQSIPYSKDYVPQTGDVMSLPAGLGQNAKAGHVAIWNGRYWVSDFVQKNTRGNTAATSDASYQNIVKGVSVPTIARMVNPSAKQAVPKSVQTAVAQKPSGNSVNTSQTNNGQWPAFKTEFVKKFYPAAVAVSKGLKGVISPEGILAQWALETGWGRKITPGTEYNIGNHKADIYWKGAKTKDKILDKRTGRRDHYRIYTEQDLVKESIRFLSTQKYAAVRSAKNEYEALVAMKKAGYAEGDNYAETIMKINKDIKAHAKSAILASQAQQAQRMVAQNQQAQGMVVKNDNRRYVNVNIPNMNVKTSSNTVSGNTVAAMKETQNYLFNQLGVSMT